MNWKTWIPLVLAVGLALVAAKLTHNVIAGKKAAGAKEAQSNFVQIVVARGDLPVGATLTKENLTLAPIPGTTPPAHTYTSTDDLLDRVSTQPLVQGQPINEKLLAPKGSGIGLQALVPTGMRAITIEVNEFSGIANLVAPGMNVDVVATFRDDATHDTVSRTVVQNVKVLAVGPRMSAVTADDEKSAYKSVTLLASPKEAERVELATYTGRPRIVLRSGRDNSTLAANQGAKLSEIAGGTADAINSGAAWLNAMMTRRPTSRPSDTNVEKVSDVKTRPIDPFGDYEARPQQRTVKIIRGGVESSVMFEAQRAPRRSDIMTDTSSDLKPVESNK